MFFSAISQKTIELSVADNIDAPCSLSIFTRWRH